MSRSKLVMIGMTIGSFVGGYVPVLWGADLFSYTSLFGNGIGGVAGVLITYKLTQNL